MLKKEKFLKNLYGSAPVLWPGKFHGQRSLAGYSPWDHKESDMTERTYTHTHTHTHTHTWFYEVLQTENTPSNPTA